MTMQLPVKGRVRARRWVVVVEHWVPSARPRGGDAGAVLGRHWGEGDAGWFVAMIQEPRTGLLYDARRRTPSRSPLRPGKYMTRPEVADAVNAALHEIYPEHKGRGLLASPYRRTRRSDRKPRGKNGLTPC